MKAIAFNGSPRKNWNTAGLLKAALNGIADMGAETELIHLRNVDLKGCYSCFACKRAGAPTYGHCVIKDETSELIKKAEEADILIFGSPVYFAGTSSDMRTFLERLIFSHFPYDNEQTSLWPKKTHCGLIYTMNQPDEAQYEQVLYDSVGSFAEKVFATTETFYSVDTCQFADYSKYVCKVYDAKHKEERLKNVFPEECERAYEFGKKLCRNCTQEA